MTNLGLHAPNRAGSTTVVSLTHKLMKLHISDFVYIANQIPLVKYSCDDLLSEGTVERPFIAKWRHSLASIKHSHPVAMLVAYERNAEDVNGYRYASTYISIVATHDAYRLQGIGSHLLCEFINKERPENFFELHAPKELISVQTNSAEYNQTVIDWYKRFGFCEAGTKHYANRTDVILHLKL